MKKIVLTACLLASQFAMANKAPDSVMKLVPELEQWGENPVFVKYVKMQNNKNMSLDDIKKRDAEWRQTEGMDLAMQEMMSNEAAVEMLKMEHEKGFMFESFLMDNKGANVAMTNKTSDYWQGDESKFIESYKDGKGAYHVGDMEYDESADAFLVQVSVPVVDNGKVIGAMTVGINVDKYELSL